MAGKVKITDTTLRDAHQSLWATRMRTDDMLPVAELLDDLGYHSLECWGGATFDVCLRFLEEDPWERLRALKKHITRTPLQMLLRGQNLVGYKHYPDDVVERFIAKAVENGISIIRIFDALNDVRNLEFSMRVAKREGAHVQATVAYTVSPIHTTEHYVRTAVELAQLGADSICLKDMAGLLTPYRAYELITEFRKHLSLPIQLHSHYIGGLAPMTYIKAVEAGVDVLDTASAPMAFGASQPPVETIVSALRGTPYEIGMDLDKLFEVARFFEDLRRKRGFDRGITRITDMQVFSHQVPGGMISNLVSQLEQQKALDKLPLVKEEIPRVRKDLGYPPLVTPTSQIVGTQAVLNILTGERYKVVSGEAKAYARGLYGRPPGPIDPEVRRRLIGDESPIDCRPADQLSPMMEAARKEAGALARCEEDVISYALFPSIALKFFRERENPSLKKTSHAETQQPTEEVEEMNVKEIKELVQIISDTDIAEITVEGQGNKVTIKKANAFAPSVSAASTYIPAPAAPAAQAAKIETGAKREEEVVKPNHYQVVAPMVGTFYQAPSPDAEPYVKEGDYVKAGQPLCIIEAMKLMNEIESDVDGRIVKILVENAEPVEYGQPLFIIERTV